MTGSAYKNAVSRFKRELDQALPAWRGKLGVGGNIFHKKPNPHGALLLTHSILNYGDTFNASCWISLYHEPLGLEVAIALMNASADWRDWFESEWRVLLSTGIPDAHFDWRAARLCDDAGAPDAAAWPAAIAAWLPEAEKNLLRRFADVGGCAQNLAGDLLEAADSQFEFSGWRRYELMLVAARLSNAAWYDAACEKLLRICAARDADPGNFLAVTRHLEATPPTELGKVESARKRFKALLLRKD